ncbi:MAG: HlyD family efflux transporter periplasmic adaptor subunit [Cyanobacteria bacterium J06635_15]
MQASNLDHQVRYSASQRPEIIPPISPAPPPPCSPAPDLLSLNTLPPVRRWTQWGGLAIAASVGLATALAAFTPYRVTVKAEATVRPAGELKQVEATTAGTVVEIQVTENQSVQAGEVVARLNDTQLQTRKNQLQTNLEQAQQQRQQVKAQIQALERRIQAEGDRAQRLIDTARAELLQAHRVHSDQQIVAMAEVDEIEAQLRSEQASLEATQLQVQRYESLAATGAISQEQLEEARLARQQQQEVIAATQARLRRVRTRLNPSDAEVAIAQERIAQEQASRAATLAALNQEREALMQQAIDIQQQQLQDRHALNQVEQDLLQTVIRAPVTGTLFQLNLRNPGQAVTAGDSLAQIAPNASGLTIKALVPTSEIRQIAVGQPAHLRISACPYPDYGTLAGNVQQISPDVVTAQPTGAIAGPPSSSPGSQPGHFEVTLQPDNLAFGQGSRQCSLRPGMTARADILTQEETVLKFLLRKARLLTSV